MAKKREAASREPEQTQPRPYRDVLAERRARGLTVGPAVLPVAEEAPARPASPVSGAEVDEPAAPAEEE